MSRGECPNPQPDCKYAGDCFSDVHHLMYPRKDYIRQPYKDFRELPENKERLCRREHDEIHATELPPERPPIEVVIAALAMRNAKGRTA